MADFLALLTPEQWNHRSLCHKWRICDVAAHVVSYEECRLTDQVKLVVKAGLRPNRVNDLALAAFGSRSQQDVIAFYRTHLTPRGDTARFGGRVGLVDAVIHHQDMRRPLGMQRPIPEERLRCALPFAVVAPPLRGFWRARGVRLIATDLGWSRGSGPEARGTGEAILMVLAGRREVAGELTGPGAAILQRRLR